jgi:ATP synthase protein I
MPGESRGSDAWSGVGIGWAIISTLIAGMVVMGGLGYLADRLAGTDSIFLSIGVVIGGGLGTYLVYLRHGKGDRDEG